MSEISFLIDDIQNELLNASKKRMDDNTSTAKSYDEFKEMIETGGFVLAHWDGTVETENKIKQDTKATIRCIPYDKKNPG